MFSNIVSAPLFIQKEEPVYDNDVVNKKFLNKQLTLLNSITSINSSKKIIDKILAKHQLLQLVEFNITEEETKSIVGENQLPIKNDDIKYPVSKGGWMYINDINNYPGILNQNISQKINWIFLNNLNRESLYNYGNMICFFVRIRLHNMSKMNRPFIKLYTHDLYNNEYKSSIVYSLHGGDISKQYDLQQKLNSKDIVLYIGKHPINHACLKDLDDVEEFVECNNNAVYTGPNGQIKPSDDENISTISLSTESDDEIGNVRFTLMEVGYRFGTSINRITTYFE
jgi:hypothetical protein